MDGQAQIGLIGVGLLGSAVAERLLSRGFAVSGFDPVPAQCEHLMQLGGTIASGPMELFGSCRTVILSLPTSVVARSVMESVVCEAHAGIADQIVVDTTTGSPDEMLAIGHLLSTRQIGYVEATVAGSSVQMRVGEAILFVGGEQRLVERSGELLSALSSKHFYLGPLGAASRFKLVHNLVLGLHRAVLAEGLVFGEALGFDASQVLRILEQTPAFSAVMKTKGHKMATGDFSAQARLTQHLKDVRLMLCQAAQHDVCLPLSSLHASLLERAEQLGFGNADNSAVIESIRQRPPK